MKEYREGRERSAEERSAGEQSAEEATRDVSEDMRELDRAGAVPTDDQPRPEQAARRADDASDDDSDDASGAADVGTQRTSFSFGSMGGRTAALGLAATSLAILAGRSVVPGAERGTTALAAAPIEETPVESAVQSKEWDLTVTDHERVDFFIEFLMGKNYDKTKSWLERMGKYGPMIQNELRERGMPQDLLYLTMIESGLNPNAYSKAHAAGLWQFIEETGERYGLEVSSYVDERRDPVKSTDSALRYLTMMHERFDSWYLSAAGYNTGENRVGRLMRETTGSEKGSDEGYWDIWERLPRETRDYVPLMLAMGHIAKDPAKYGFTNLQMQEPLRFEEVTVQGGTRLSTVAEAAGVDLDVVADLNPHLVQKQTPPGRDWAVRIPVGQTESVLAALDGARPGGPVLGD